MAQKYAKDQPAGFTNRIEKVAIVGVSDLPASHAPGQLLLIPHIRLLVKLADILLLRLLQLESIQLLP